MRSCLHAIMQQRFGEATQGRIDLSAGPWAPMIARLADEGGTLMSTGRHAWVRRRASSLNDLGNWAAYAMEVHICYALEVAGIDVANSVNVLPGSGTDVDAVWRQEDGVEVRAEFVAIREPEKFWTDREVVGDGLEALTADHDIDGEADLVRVMQEKIRLKTISDAGDAVKFPVPDEASAHIIVADASRSLGLDPDWYDLQEITLGRPAALAGWRHNVLGLFEEPNAMGEAFDDDFLRNRFLRERVHAIFFLIDESPRAGPLYPLYAGHAVGNPLLALSEAQRHAIDLFGSTISTLVTRGWMREPTWRAE